MKGLKRISVPQALTERGYCAQIPRDSAVCFLRDKLGVVGQKPEMQKSKYKMQN